MGSAIHLRSAVALLGRFPALAHLDLDVADGEMVLLEGPNGAGKTSALRLCAGLLPLSAGAGVVMGADLARRQKPAGIGFLGHASGLYEDLTAWENVAFRLRLSGRSDRAAGAALERVGLEGHVHSVPVTRLSAGQRRRVALAALDAIEPRLWLLDEPHAGLDAESRLRLDAMLTSAAQKGAAVVLASHELDRAGRLVTRRVRIERGRVDGARSEPAAPAGVGGAPRSAAAGLGCPAANDIAGVGGAPRSAAAGLGCPAANDIACEAIDVA